MCFGGMGFFGDGVIINGECFDLVCKKIGGTCRISLDEVMDRTSLYGLREMIYEGNICWYTFGRVSFSPKVPRPLVLNSFKWCFYIYLSL